MTDAATAYGPEVGSLAGASSRPADHRARLHVVPDPDTLQSETAIAAGVPSDHETAGQIVSDSANPGAAALQIAGWRGLYAATRAYWTPPAVFTDQPATLADLASYARHAPWTQQHTGILRTAGIGYYRLVAYPYTVISRYREWIFQRPGRLIPAIGLIKLAAMTGPGMWAVDHLIYPAARLVGQILL